MGACARQWEQHGKRQRYDKCDPSGRASSRASGGWGACERGRRVWLGKKAGPMVRARWGCGPMGSQGRTWSRGEMSDQHLRKTAGS